MAYCTAADLTERMSTDELIQLTDDAGTGVPNQDIISTAIAAAQGTIDGYLRGRYPVPLASVPGLVKNLALDLAAYKLFKRRNQLMVNEARELMYKQAVSQLKDIQAGIIILETADKKPLPPASLMRTNKRPADRMFGKDKLEGF
ncbi:MAG: gp436 family protein [Elusimicrobiales bacterium]